MGKSLPPTISPAQLQQLSGISTHLIHTPKRTKPISLNPLGFPGIGGSELKRPKLKKKMEGSNNDGKRSHRTPLSQVVSDCVRRWFQDTLKEAKGGDLSMQVVVAQMYYSGYGVPKDTKKGRIWMTRASRFRSSVWKVSNKHPGYNASDSDSDELIGNS